MGKVKNLRPRDVELTKARGVAGGKASFTDFVVTHPIDKSSPNLM
jgi:type VI protein secretion system component Hcp